MSEDNHVAVRERQYEQMVATHKRIETALESQIEHLEAIVASQKRRLAILEQVIDAQKQIIARQDDMIVSLRSLRERHNPGR